MKHVSVVIGANYGDEGKGLITDYLTAHNQAKYVVRFNGGSQAGHTVCTDDDRHVFSHFSSGSFAGAATILGPEFIINPILFFRELDQHEILRKVKVFVDRSAKITTPYDMMINQIIEKYRRIDNSEHGSCGVGISETIERCQRGNHPALRLSIGMICDCTDEDLYYYLQYIRREWAEFRLSEALTNWKEKITPSDLDEMFKMFKNDNIFWTYLEQLKKLRNKMYVTDTKKLIRDVLQKGEEVVFEGAQGLGLDQVQGTFPYVTRSFTGLTNVLELIPLGTKIDVYYVTRAYLTRHGAGPMENELKKPPTSLIVEKTNVTNEHQGSFRYGHLDVKALKNRIGVDLQNVNDRDFTHHVAITCLDQMNSTVSFYHGSKLHRLEKNDFVDFVANETGVQTFLLSHGETRNTISQHYFNSLLYKRNLSTPK